MPIDILSGGCDLRTCLEKGFTPTDLQTLTSLDEDAWWSEVEPHLLYERNGQVPQRTGFPAS